jgi:predicted enzyme related to lactoylglutathione lyase
MSVTVYMFIIMEHDLLAAIEFYTMLGFKLKFHLKNQWAEMLADNIKIGLCYIGQELPERRSGLVVQVNDLMDFYTKYKDALPFIGEPKEKVHGIMIGLKDPGGNIIDLYQPTPEKVADLIKKAKKEDNCCDGTMDLCACKSSQIPRA